MLVEPEADRGSRCPGLHTLLYNNFFGRDRFINYGYAQVLAGACMRAIQRNIELHEDTGEGARICKIFGFAHP